MDPDWALPAVPGAVPRDPEVEMLALRERYRDWYARERDPIAAERLAWRAQSFRHLVHLLPGRSVLQLGSGETAELARVLDSIARGRNPILAASFQRLPAEARADLPPRIERISLEAFPGALAGRQFDYVLAIDLLDRRNAVNVLAQVHELLAPGGELVMFESNPWNLLLAARRQISAALGRRPDPRSLMSRPQLYELLSEVGFIRVFSVYTDFVYAPLNRTLVWLLRNLSIVLENAPLLRSFAGAILLHAQKPPRKPDRPQVSLCEHEVLRGAVSVVIPCRNEEMNVGPLVERLLALYGDYIHEILPLDDGSTDATAAVVEALARRDSRVRLIRRRPPHGVGCGLAEGYASASGRWVLSMDCDFQHLLPELRDLFDAAAQGHRVVIGSRFSRRSVLLNYPFPKIVANRVFHVLAQLLLWRRFRDLTNNLKLIDRQITAQMRLQQPGFAANAETGLQPVLMGYAIKEVPISWINRSFDMGASSFRLIRVGGGYAAVLWAMVRARWFRSGPYAALRGLASRRAP